MTPTPSPAADDLDRLLSDFFKAQLRRPWPNAPGAPAEPARAAAAAPRDTTARARATLAASVALLLGTGLFLADGFRPGVRPGPDAAPAPRGNLLLPDAGADGKGHAPLEKIGEEKAKGGNGAPKIDMSGVE